MSKLAKALTAAAGNAGESLYVEDVFSTYLYAGNGADQTITNGIDLDGEGGLVWCKPRTVANPHYLADTVRGVNKFLESNASNAEDTSSTSGGNTGDVNAFNSNGFSVGSTGRVNQFGQNFASWTFRKAEKFFDVVTYTGDGTNGREIPHSLNGDVGMVIVKCTSDADQWLVWHKNTSTGYLRLDGTGALVTSFAQFKFGNGTTTVNPTSSVFTVAGDSDINGSGRTYVAYLFASDAGGFGDDGSESIIKCGSYTGNGSTQEINLGFEPQWLLIKSSTQTDSWFLTDTMRGMPNNSPTPYLLPNLSNAEAEASAGYFPQATATGFKIGASGSVNSSGQTFIYIAIRRPMKTPESGTEVFSPAAYSGNNTARIITAGFPIDAELNLVRSSAAGHPFVSRLTGGKDLTTDTTDAEGTLYTSYLGFDNQVGLEFKDATGYSYYNSSANTYISYMFKRATGFFDVVAYSGDGTSGRQIPHNLGSVPQLMITKARNSVELWRIGYTAGQIFTNWGSTGYTWISNGNIYGDGTQWIDPTESYVTMQMNTSGRDYIQYLFGTLAGVSKVGSYTGNGTTQNIECGFSTGARFLMLWNQTNPTLTYVWDSVRGIITGSPDPRLAINSTAAEVTSNDALNAYAGGFGVTSSTVANRSGDTYIFLAIA